MFRICAVLACTLPFAITAFSADVTDYGGGPYNGSFIASGLGLKKPLKAGAPVSAGAVWSMHGWVKADGNLPQKTLIAGVGERRYLAIMDGKPAFWAGDDLVISAVDAMDASKWHLLAASYDGSAVTLFVDGAVAGSKALTLPDCERTMVLAPHVLPWTEGEHFAGKIAEFTLSGKALTKEEMSALYDQRPQFDLMAYEAGSKNWPVQTRAQAGYRAPQEPATLPVSSAPFSKPKAKAAYAGPALVPRTANQWTIAGGWRLAAGPTVTAKGAEISQAGFASTGWYEATVPGTVLTTLIDRGIYPDPDYGLNNMAIPESLNRQPYWYRTEFTPPISLASRQLTLRFEGINYAAAVWLNGKQIGNIKGAFMRGVFNVTGALVAGRPNALAVLIAPPPHPGIPQEQSVKGGPGENGGLMCLDGPTFIDTEGWDWIPAVRDRNTGIWQEVTLRATDAVKIGDTQVATRLPLPDTTHATVSINVPLRNDSAAPITGTVHASFEGVDTSNSVTVPAGGTANVSFAVNVDKPRLWWPNGYGKPELYHLKLRFAGPQGESDVQTFRFGIREITYELSLLDQSGHLRRVEFSPSSAKGEPVVDVSHEGIIESAKGWVASLRPIESPAIKALEDTRVTPYLVIRVNGVRIACKGGNWGMDDSRKRVSREKLEPYFRLHRDANLNIIRNWCGQSTEEVFYELADEYGLLVWNDFWQSTQNYNVEPSAGGLFLENARDTIQRYRNHPSIAIWCGRNEGVPSPAVNEGLEELVRTLDGTRYYTPSSNTINLQNSGPYRYQDPAGFFTKFARGFAVELGIPSFPTIDAFRAAVPAADQWPINDTWAYHDWHQSGNGVIAPFMEALNKEFGAPANLEDFERKAQMLNYAAHRAIFEGFNAHLWNPNSARMLWMTQPAWPSTMWQILSSDYDTQASFYGVKKAAEPVHIQLNLPDLKIAVINNTNAAITGGSIRARVFNAAGTQTFSRDAEVNAEANAATESFGLEAAGLVFIKLELRDSQSALLGENFYWYSADDADFRQLNRLPPASIQASTTRQPGGIRARLTNSGQGLALMTKLTLRRAEDGERVLPAYYADNYISLLPGETREVAIEYSGTEKVTVGLSGWNITPVYAREAK